MMIWPSLLDEQHDCMYVYYLSALLKMSRPNKLGYHHQSISPHRLVLIAACGLNRDDENLCGMCDFFLQLLLWC